MHLVELHHEGEGVHDDEEEDQVLKRSGSDKSPHLKPGTSKYFSILIKIVSNIEYSAIICSFEYSTMTIKIYIMNM